MARVRLDTLLADRGLFASRSRAAASVMAGEVLVGPGRRRVDKPGHLVARDVIVEVVAGPRYVSRGGVKLANALDALDLDVTGRRALDVGASTGGFTDCLLQRGAAEVIALDVAYGELAWSLRTDPRVTVLERVNARSLAPEDLPYAPDLVVADVSFISLTTVLPVVLRCAATRFDALALVKPQFEVGRERVGRGGVVREPAARRAALIEVARAASAGVAGTGAPAGAPVVASLRGAPAGPPASGAPAGACLLGVASSGLPGPKGNRESFLWLAEAGREGAVEDVEAAVAAVEPGPS